MEKRALGKTGESLSVVGFGGIVVKDTSVDEAAHCVNEAIARGINYFDVAPSYGNAEERLGPALAPHRDGVFLACKTGKRRAAEAAAELDNSLRLLKTGRIDLYQFHAVSSMADVDAILGAGGAMEAVLAAREAGKLRFIGFSAHDEDAAQAMLERYPFDSVMFPFNAACWRDGAFGPRLHARAHELGIGILALKALARRPWAEGEARDWPKCWYKPIDDVEDARRALRFTLALPVTAAVSPSHAELLWTLCDAAESLGEAQADANPADAVPLFTAAAS